MSGGTGDLAGNVLDLSQASFSQDTLGVYIGDFLYRTTLSRSAMLGGDDTSVGSLAEFFYELILSIDNECRVEGSEGVSLHWSWGWGR